MEELLKQLLMQRAHSTLNEAAVEHQAVTQQLAQREQTRKAWTDYLATPGHAPQVVVHDKPGDAGTVRLNVPGRAPGVGRATVEATNWAGARGGEPSTVTKLNDAQKAGLAPVTPSGFSEGRLYPYVETEAPWTEMSGRRDPRVHVDNVPGPSPVSTGRGPVVQAAPSDIITESASPAAYLVDPEPSSPDQRDALNAALAERLAGGANDYWQLQGLSPWSAAGVMSKLPEAMLNQEEDAIEMGGPKIGRPHEPANLIGGSGDDNRDKLAFPRAKPQRPSLRILGGPSQVMPEYGSMEAATGEPDDEMLKRLYELYGVRI